MAVLPMGDRKPDPYDGAGESVTDASLAAEVAKHVLAVRFRWVRGLRWLKWTGTHWTAAPDQAVHEEVRRYLLGRWRDALDVLKNASDTDRGSCDKVASAWRGTLTRSRISAITALAQGIPTILTDPATLDAHPDLLNVGNGVIDLRSGKLRPHDPKLLLTRYTPVDYRPDAEHRDWTAALQAIPPSVRSWAQLRYGQAVTGYPPPDDLLIVQDGSGENGKTTIVVGIRGALGDYFTMVSHRALLGDASQHPTELMAFRGARVAALEELPEERRLSVTRLKSIVGTPNMRARYTGKDEVEWTTSHSLFVNTNHLPVVDETDHGTWRRLARLSYPFRFLKPSQTPTAAHERAGDSNLRQRVQEGRHGQHEAVLAWLVTGAVRWYQADRIMPPLPARVDADTADWRSRTDLLLAYGVDRLIFDSGSHIPCRELLDDLNEWLELRGHRRWSDRTLAARLQEHSEYAAHSVAKDTVRPGGLKGSPSLRNPDPFTTVPKQYKAWLGLRFRTEDDDTEDDESAGQDGSGTAGTGSSDDSKVSSFARNDLTTGTSGTAGRSEAPDSRVSDTPKPSPLAVAYREGRRRRCTHGVLDGWRRCPRCAAHTCPDCSRPYTDPPGAGCQCHNCHGRSAA